MRESPEVSKVLKDIRRNCGHLSAEEDSVGDRHVVRAQLTVYVKGPAFRRPQLGWWSNAVQSPQGLLSGNGQAGTSVLEQ